MPKPANAKKTTKPEPAREAPERSPEDERERIINGLMRRYAVVQARARRFADKLAHDCTGVAVAHALEWSISSFNDAGEAAVLQTVIGAIWHNEEARPLSLAYLADYARTRALSNARHPQRSTSPTSNLMSETTNAAWAALAVDLAEAVTPEALLLAARDRGYAEGYAAGRRSTGDTL